MKVFYDHQIFSLQTGGGPSRYFCKLVSNLINTDIQPKIFAQFSSNNFICEIEKILKNHIKINDTFLKYATLKNKIFFLNTCLNYLNLKKFDPDIIHSTYYNINYLKEKKPVVVTVYDLIHEKFSKYYNKKSVWYPKKKILDRCDHIICISENTKKDLKDIYGINDKKISTIYLATDIDQINSFKNRLIEDKYFLYVGNRNDYKNFKILIKMLAKYAGEFKNYKCILFGGEKLSKLEKKIIIENKIDLKLFIELKGDDKILKNLYENAEFLFIRHFTRDLVCQF